MTELDQIWSQMLDEAVLRSSDDGRSDLADYLRLRAANDAVRSAGVKWLFDTVIDIAGRASASSRGVTIERHEPHSFGRGSSRMVGARIEVRQGVRCLTVEAGWARTPSDGIMRDGILAFSRFSHFGMPRAGLELSLTQLDPLPEWLTPDGVPVGRDELARQVAIVLDRQSES